VRDSVERQRQPGQWYLLFQGVVSRNGYGDPIDASQAGRCSATSWLGTSASRWVGMTGDGKGPADGIGGAWWCPGCRGGDRVVVVSRSRG